MGSCVSCKGGTYLIMEQSKAIGIIWAGSLTLVFFWVLNIFKEAYPAFKNFLNFYPPVGPLLGLFLFSILSLFIFLIVLGRVGLKNQKTAFWMLIVSTILFFLMTFPPIFEIFVELFK